MCPATMQMVLLCCCVVVLGVVSSMCIVNTLTHGASTGFSRGNALLLLEDIEAVRPTVFVGVPRLYNR